MLRGAHSPMNLHGIYVAAVTPWGPAETVDETALRRHVEMLLAAGVDGICVGGSTGEFPRLEIGGRKRLLRTVLEIVAGRVPVLAGVGHASLDGTLALLAGSAGAAAAVVPPPYYFPYAQPEVLAFYRRVTAAAELPVFVYNIPQFTTGVEPATACELLASGLCAGIKDSSGSMAMLEALAAERRRSPFIFFCGRDECLPRALEMGADGALSGVAACAPEPLVALYRAFRAGDAALVARAHQLVAEFIDRMDAFPPPVAIRIGLEVRGIPVGPHAVPLAPETEQRARELRRWLEEWFLRATSVATVSRQPSGSRQ